MKRMDYRTVNPTTEEDLARYELHADAAVDTALGSSARAHGIWRRAPIAERAAALARAAERLDAEAERLARIMALEMGKPIAQGEAEARKCALGCRYFAEHAERFLREEPREAAASSAVVRREPLGPLLAIMPWNFPFWQFYRFAAPALAAGNTVLLKHAPRTPQCALAIEDLMLRAGFPQGVVQSLFLSDEQAARVIADDRVRGVTLTGSTRAGKAVASAAGARIKPSVMELGGSDPFLVLDDADVAEAVRVGVEARCQNSGQSCIAAKRFLLQRGIARDFRDAFTAALQARRVGDPLVDGTEIGPLARADLCDTLDEQVRSSIAQGARVLCGARRTAGPGGRGFFYAPTVLDDVAPASPAARDELFGPVAALFEFGDEAEAFALANGTRYGLGASVWTRDLDRARRFAAGIESGSVFVNAMVRSDPRLPFGGVKDSGFGRELGPEGLDAFVNLKTIWIA